LKTGTSELLLTEEKRNSIKPEGLNEEDESAEPKVKRKCVHKKKKIIAEIPVEPKPQKVKRKKSHKNKSQKELESIHCNDIGGLEEQVEGTLQKGKKYCELPSISNSPEVIFSKVLLSKCLLKYNSLNSLTKSIFF